MKADADTTVTRKIFFDMAIGGQPAGRIVLGLFGNTAPKTVTNFVSLAENEVCSSVNLIYGIWTPYSVNKPMFLSNSLFSLLSSLAF